MIRRQNSLPEILSIIGQKPNQQICKPPIQQFPQGEPSQTFKYILHEPQERIQLAKMFYHNMKKRQIARNMNEIKQLSTLNGRKITPSQIIREKLYIKENQIQENPSIYLQQNPKLINQQLNLRKNRPRAYTTQLNRTSSQQSIIVRSPNSKNQQSPKKIRLIDEVKGQTKLFTYIYKQVKNSS